MADETMTLEQVRNWHREMSKHLAPKRGRFIDDAIRHDEMADAIDFAIAERKVPEWKPIETAPKDIEFRCLLSNRISVVTGYWDGETWINERSRTLSAYWATHWMPLPAAPKVTP